MHLSFLSESFLSDTLNDHGLAPEEMPDPIGSNQGRAHRDGLLRGLALLAIVAVLMSFAFISSAIHAAEADTALLADDVIHCASAAP